VRLGMSDSHNLPDIYGQDPLNFRLVRGRGAIEKTYAQADIVLVEPEPVSMDSLKRALEQAGYPRLMQISDPLQMHRYLQTADPDLLVVDVDGPNFDGPALLAEVISQLPPDSFLPVLALGSADPAAGRRSLEAGAKDFLAMPVDPEELELHVHALLDTRFVHLRLRETRDVLEDLARRRTYELRQAQQETLELLSRVAELRDDPTGEHTKRVGRLSGLVAQELGLPREQVRLIAQAAPLHDLGKIAITDRVLLKEGGFDTLEERLEMRQHAALGAELLSGANSDVLRMAREIAASHHERWDGQGYPRGLRGEEIPVAARVVAIADVFDALLHTRPHKAAWSIAEALSEIKQQRGWQFDPRVVDALLRIQRLKERVGATEGWGAAT
jgi:putative two-component system response regulator